MELDIVSQLKDFSTLSFQRKLEIINKGRSTPDLKNLHQTAGKNNSLLSKKLIRKERVVMWLQCEESSFQFSLSAVCNKESCLERNRFL